MSTKTTFKRIALVAVAALTGGLLSIVSTPAANAVGNQELVSSIAVGTVPAARAGVWMSVPVVLNLPSTMADTDTIVLGVQLLTAPATSTLASVTANPTQGAFTGVTNSGAARLYIDKSASGSGSFGTLTTGIYSTSGNASANATYQLGASDATVPFDPHASSSALIFASRSASSGLFNS